MHFTIDCTMETSCWLRGRSLNIGDPITATRVEIKKVSEFCLTFESLKQMFVTKLAERSLLKVEDLVRMLIKQSGVVSSNPAPKQFFFPVQVFVSQA